MTLKYLQEFDNIKITTLNSYKYKKSLENVSVAMEPSEYITLDGIQDIFEISRYQLNRYLKQLNIKPIGEAQNIIDGKRLRGVGKFCFNVKSVDMIYNLISQQVDIEKIKRQAFECVKSYENDINR